MKKLGWMMAAFVSSAVLSMTGCAASAEQEPTSSADVEQRAADPLEARRDQVGWRKNAFAVEPAKPSLVGVTEDNGFADPATTNERAKLADRPVLLGAEPSDATKDSAKLADRPVLLGAEPSDATKDSAKLTDRPVMLGGEPSDTTKDSAKLTDRPVLDAEARFLSDDAPSEQAKLIDRPVVLGAELPSSPAPSPVLPCSPDGIRHGDIPGC